MTTTAATTASATVQTSDKPLAVVTGASTGIGLELAKQLAENGYDLLICANESMATAASDIQSLGAAVEPVEVDLADPAGADAFASATTRTGKPSAVPARH